jgi:hypothetical protein
MEQGSGRIVGQLYGTPVGRYQGPWGSQKQGCRRFAGENEAAGAADAELCHTEAVWAE